MTDAMTRFERAIHSRTNPFAFPVGWENSLSVRRREGSLRHRYGTQLQAFNRASDKMLAEAKAGTYRCPGCKALRPALTDGMGEWAPWCDNCRGDEDDE